MKVNPVSVRRWIVNHGSAAGGAGANRGRRKPPLVRQECLGTCQESLHRLITDSTRQPNFVGCLDASPRQSRPRLLGQAGRESRIEPSRLLVMPHSGSLSLQSMDQSRNSRSMRYSTGGQPGLHPLEASSSSRKRAVEARKRCQWARRRTSFQNASSFGSR